MSGLRVSCIIPVHNGRRYLAEAIESVLGQSRRPSEVLVIDDGSTDGSSEVIERYAGEIVRARQAHAGVSAARNHGVRLSSGNLIAFLDADDVWLPDKLERQVSYLREHTKVDLCTARSSWFWTPELPERERRADPRYGDGFWTGAPSGHINTWLGRRGLFEELGGFREELSYSEDTDWYLRVRDAGRVIHILPDVVSRRRLHGANATGRRRAPQIEALALTIKGSLDRRRRAGGEP